MMHTMLGESFFINMGKPDGHYDQFGGVFLSETAASITSKEFWYSDTG
jgi:hypothetical protein